MQANIYSQHPNLASFQPLSNNIQTDRNNNQRNNAFDANNGLGDNDLISGLVTVLIQLLLQQFGNRQGQEQPQPVEQHNDNDASQLNFTENDKALLLNAIGIDADSGTQINRIDDTDASTTLNGGDNIALQTNADRTSHSVTDAEARKFIELRNPPNTTKLPLSNQQSTLLENRYDATDISIADNNADSKISVGDYLTGFQSQGITKTQIDIPVDVALVGLLNA